MVMVMSFGICPPLDFPMVLIVTCGSITKMYFKSSWVGEVHICSKALASENDASTPLGK